MNQAATKKRIGKIIFRVLGLPLLFLIGFTIISLIWIRTLPHPKGPAIHINAEAKATSINDSTKVWKNNWYVKSQSGHHILYVEGSPEEMGTAQGVLVQHLIKHQEVAFTDEIKRLIPSPKFLSFLQYFVKVLNKDLENYVLPDFQKEIKAISQFADTSFNWIGPNYARILNYHAAHDVGHALQNYMLVGCTSFATWNQASENQHLIVGRNFDFYVGETFAEEKILLIAKPDNGYGFMSVTWGGFIGVVSGLNEKGLSVTINAAPSEIPYGAATPVSLVAREVLQYAATIEEAYAIIEKRKMFVSETFLIASAEDNKAVLIEKTPTETVFVSHDEDFITCTNHYQSKDLDNKNASSVLEDATWYRSLRTNELLENAGDLNPQKAVEILRDYKGLTGKNIGLGNEMSINQFIAHHSVVMDNNDKTMWLSTAPWQLGNYQYYDLEKLLQHGWEALSDSYIQAIAADDFLDTEEFNAFSKFHQQKLNWTHKTWTPKNMDEIIQFINLNSEYFYTYELAGDMALKINHKEKARDFYAQALTLKISNHDERIRIENKLEALTKASK